MPERWCIVVAMSSLSRSKVDDGRVLQIILLQ